ncbi:uncharacterized protein K02A2.6-like [Camellia sinensis]|uniref:uncharacterized protein K02A2.6-like n=1 Tax=Camellia sinensis TaxID=4442 RepID=UPI00103677B2|nr:uncharacterized protein K02A2.6-like [Camellia sinensis]
MGLDIVVPLLRAPGNKRFLIVATDYFTKWIEAEALIHIRDVNDKRFVWRNIITQFGIPRALVSDNGTQFDCGIYREFCNAYGIRPYFSSPAYLQSNGQAESSTKINLDDIKKRLKKLTVDRSKSCPVCYGLVALLQGDPKGKRRSLCALEPRQFSP